MREGSNLCSGCGRAYLLGEIMIKTQLSFVQIFTDRSVSTPWPPVDFTHLFDLIFCTLDLVQGREASPDFSGTNLRTRQSSALTGNLQELKELQPGSGDWLIDWHESTVINCVNHIQYSTKQGLWTESVKIDLLCREILKLAMDGGTSNCDKSLGKLFQEHLNSRHYVNALKNNNLLFIAAGIFNILELLTEKIQ